MKFGLKFGLLGTGFGSVDPIIAGTYIWYSYDPTDGFAVSETGNVIVDQDTVTPNYDGAVHASNIVALSPESPAPMPIIHQLGADNVLNGDFTTDIVGWLGDASGTAVWDTLNGGCLKLPSTSIYNYIRSNISPTQVAGNTQRITFKAYSAITITRRLSTYNGVAYVHFEDVILTAGVWTECSFVVTIVASIDIYLGFDNCIAGDEIYYDDVVNETLTTDNSYATFTHADGSLETIDNVATPATTYNLTVPSQNYFTTDVPVSQADRDYMEANPNAFTNMMVLGVEDVNLSFNIANVKNWFPMTEGSGEYLQDWLVPLGAEINPSVNFAALETWVLSPNFTIADGLLVADGSILGYARLDGVIDPTKLYVNSFDVSEHVDTSITILINGSSSSKPNINTIGMVSAIYDVVGNTDGKFHIQGNVGTIRSAINSMSLRSVSAVQIQNFTDAMRLNNQRRGTNDLRVIKDASGRIVNVVENTLVRFDGTGQVIDSGVALDGTLADFSMFMAFTLQEADSGRKVKLQKNTGIMTLRYLTGPLELFHKKQATLVATLIGKFYTAHQVMRVTDDITGNRFIEINMPMMLPKLPPELANLVAQGMPVEFAFQAMMTGQLSPQVQQAIQADQQAQMANQQYQQAQQQAMMATQQQQQQLVMEGLSPQNLQPVPVAMPKPPQANSVATLKAPELSKEVENSKKSKLNSLMATKRPDAPEGLQYMYEEMLNPETGLPETDKEGRILLTPVSQPDTMIEIESFDITIKPSSYDDEDEKAQLMMEVLLNGPAGVFAQNASPASYAKMVSLNVQSMKTKYSPEIAQMFNEMAMAMGQNPEFEAYMRTVVAPSSGGAGQNGQSGAMTTDGNGGSLPAGGMGGGGSTTGKLPQNTNEGVG